MIDFISGPDFFRDRICKCYTGRGEALNTSDHHSIELTLKVDALPRTVDIDRVCKRIKWEKCSVDFIRTQYQGPVSLRLYDVLDGLAADFVSTNDIDIYTDAIVDILHKAAESIPKSKCVSHLKPFWNNELNELKGDKMVWFNRWMIEGRTKSPDNHVRQEMLRSKKVFSKGEINHKDFWRLLKKSREGCKVRVNTIRNQQGVVVYEVNEILEVWRTHFDRLSTPKSCDSYDRAHYQHVTRCVRELLALNDESPFLSQPITELEVERAIKKLNNNKSPGYDGITSEHVKYAGHSLIRALSLLYNHCIKSEYIPTSFRRGIQVPLYKGKNTCTLDCDNYRGITLLPTFNKLLEVIIWDRLKGWWFGDRIVSDLQGAGRTGHSCIHTALTLQETISKERESNDKVFVALYDVSKAFDSVWIDGLFYQLHEMGIQGSLWRILYRMYIGFLCCVRIGDRTSGWFSMDCEIHQGGYLSLVKYTAFINSLITNLEESNLCSTIYRIKTSPVGYADDMASSSVSKIRTDRAMSLVYSHSRKWRYSFNAGKSAVLVFGETPAERKIGSTNRVFKLGDNRVKERIYYDHVGVKICVKGDTHIRTEEKISKARKCLNMSTSIGIRKGGVNMSTCNIVYWSVVLPTLCFGCEIWYIKQKDIDVLLAFQRYAARRIQRLHPRSLNITSTVCLGWMSILNYIKARKIIFLRTISCMEDYFSLKRIFIERVNEFRNGNRDLKDSSVEQTLLYSEQFDLLEEVYNMGNGRMLSKAEWKKLVWKKAWEYEANEWHDHMTENEKLDLFRLVSPLPTYSVWWAISDSSHAYMRQCETMVKLLCHASLLKYDDCRLRHAPFGARMCILCDEAAYEDARHMIMQCHYQYAYRTRMLNDISEIVMIDGANVFGVLMGQYIEGWSFEDMVPIWCIACSAIAKMYRSVLDFHKRYN